MNRALAVLAGIAVLGLSACGHSAQLKSVSSNPQVQQDQAAAEKIVQGCVSKGNFLTHGGRMQILNCIAPQGHEAAFQKCATSDLAHTGVLTSGARQRFYQGLAVCLEKNR